MEHLLGDEYGPFAASYDAPSSAGLRVNSTKISAEEFRLLSPFSLEPLPWVANAFVLASNVESPGRGLAMPVMTPGRHHYHAAGLYYLQDPSAMVVAEMLDPRPGERVLDLAAAPGGKATHIVSLMRNEGLLVANEIHGQRAWDLAENLERWGARNAVITNESPERLADRFAGFFDRVLLDAPCSGEGMFRRSEAARREWSPELVHGCALRQSHILAQAARMVRPGGRLVYSTCTFAPGRTRA
jgi:16S rRNA C967 or C1407 C5-methylase (RsmB/RsmF family)